MLYRSFSCLLCGLALVGALTLTGCQDSTEPTVIENVPEISEQEAAEESAAVTGGEVADDY